MAGIRCTIRHVLSNETRFQTFALHLSKQKNTGLSLVFFCSFVLVFHQDFINQVKQLSYSWGTNWEVTGDKLGSYGGQIGKLWGTNWEVMGDKLGSYGGL